MSTLISHRTGSLLTPIHTLIPSLQSGTSAKGLEPRPAPLLQVWKGDLTEVERFNEDLQDLLELKPKKDVLFIIGAWNAKEGSQETPGVTNLASLTLEYRMKQG